MYEFVCTEKGKECAAVEKHTPSGTERSIKLTNPHESVLGPRLALPLKVGANILMVTKYVAEHAGVHFSPARGPSPQHERVSLFLNEQSITSLPAEVAQLLRG
jgi:hypothetical protein